MSFSVTLPVLDASPTFYAPATGSPTTPAGDECDPTWVVRVVEMTGAVVTTLTNADVDTITYTSNMPDQATFHFPKGAYSNTQIEVLGSAGGALEIQIFRNSDLIFWGPIIGIDASGSSGAVTCHCAGVDWYLNRRFLDGPITNLLTDPDFESGGGAWSTFGGLTSYSIITDNFVTGSHSAKLTESSAGAGAGIKQSVVVPPNGVGSLITASAWFFIKSITAPAFGSLFLVVEGTEGGVLKEQNYYPIDTATPAGRWVKASTTIWIPPNRTHTVNFKLFCPQGEIDVDDCKLVQMQSFSTAALTGSTTTPVDIARIVGMLLTVMQQPTFGKSFLWIGKNTELTGVLAAKTYQWVDHVQFDQAVREFIDRNDGIDYSVDLTPTSRTYHTYAGKRGTDRTGSVTLSYIAGDATSNCVDYRVTEDGSTCITRQTVIGSDNGPDREQGEAVDAASIGGTILQDVRQAPQGSETATLQQIADERIARFKAVPLTIEMDVIGCAGFIPALKVGDLVDVEIVDGYLNESANLRVQTITIDRLNNVQKVTVAEDSLP